MLLKRTIETTELERSRNSEDGMEKLHLIFKNGLSDKVEQERESV